MVVHGSRELADDPLFVRLLDVDPELLLPYVTRRLGGMQRIAVAAGAEALAAGDGSVRTDASPEVLSAGDRADRARLRARRARRARARARSVGRARRGRSTGTCGHERVAERGAAARAELERLAAGEVVDVVVVGGGVTGAGVALDAASRGLSVALLERRDLAHGTSRWSSKLVHGGLRYLAARRRRPWPGSPRSSAPR